MSNLAETILRDVKRYSLTQLGPVEGGQWLHYPDVLAAITAAMDPAIAERAREVLSRLRKADEYEPLGHDGWEAADLITALLAQNAALRAERDAQRRDLEKTIRNQRAELRRLQALERVHWQSVERWRGTREGLEGKVKAAEAQIAALTARVERLTGALHNCVGMLDCLVAESGRSIEWGQEDPFRMGEWFEPDDLKQLAQARAALSAITEASQ